MARVSVLVVVYNEHIDLIPAIVSALSSPEISQVIVCDNSTLPTDNESKALGMGIEYVPMLGNKGLAAAYNEGAHRCTGDALCLFDDDTEVGEDYFTAVSLLLESERGWDVALPLVMNGESVLSPCVFSGYKSHEFSQPDDVRIRDDLSGINSGMVIRRRLFDAVMHDAGLFLDLVDHKFILDVKEQGGRIVYLDGPVLRQNYSLETDSVDSSLARFFIFERDARYFYSTSLSKRFYCEAMLLLRKIKLCVRFKTIRFFGRASSLGRRRT